MNLRNPRPRDPYYYFVIFTWQKYKSSKLIKLVIMEQEKRLTKIRKYVGNRETRIPVIDKWGPIITINGIN